MEFQLAVDFFRGGKVSINCLKGPSFSITDGQKHTTRIPPGTNAFVHAAKASLGLGSCCKAKQLKTAENGGEKCKGTPAVGTVEASPILNSTLSLQF
jgi:hypothetical protein